MPARYYRRNVFILRPINVTLIYTLSLVKLMLQLASTKKTLLHQNSKILRQYTKITDTCTRCMLQVIKTMKLTILPIPLRFPPDRLSNCNHSDSIQILNNPFVPYDMVQTIFSLRSVSSSVTVFFADWCAWHKY